VSKRVTGRRLVGDAAGSGANTNEETAMPEYLLINYLPSDRQPTQEEIAEEYPKWAAFLEGLKDAGVFVDNRGLQGADVATTVRVRDGETVITDGPFAETKEYLAGYFLIQADDLDTALEHAARMPSSEYGSVEVRPVWG